MKKIKKVVAMVLAMLLVSGSCLIPSDTVPQATAATFAKGADVSWVPAMESQGNVWYNKAGVKTDILTILKNDYGMNSIRIRNFVNPSGDVGNGWCSTKDTVNLAKRAKALGMQIMIDFHYSDSWADPGKQTKPAAWSNYNVDQLCTAVYNHTKYVMEQLKAAGVTPTWVQVGNETNNGMLWPEGKASTSSTTMKNYAWFITSGYNAVKAVSSGTQVIVHLANGDQTDLYTWNIGGLVSNGAKFDLVGMSLYPTASNYSSLLSSCYTNMQNMKSKYGKNSIITECGMQYTDASTCKTFIKQLRSKVSSAGGQGVFYWEPEAYSGWNGYTMGAWAKNGKASVALDGFN